MSTKPYFGAWDHKLKLKDLLDERSDPEAVVECAAKMYARLSEFQQKHYPDDDELWDIVDEFDTIAHDGASADCDYFNEVLASLYDWADTGKRLWIA